jgi:hypothetical protein
MKMQSTIFSLMIALSVISVVQLNAQTRGRDRGGDRERSDSRERADSKEQRERYANRDDHDRNDRDRKDHDRNDRDRRDNDKWKNDRDHDRGNHYGHNKNRHDHGRTVVRHVHVHDRYCHRRPVVVRHHYTRPRYVYYRDYDVYYDYSRNVYFSYSGRTWSMSTAIPVGMRHTNLRQVKRYEIDYYDDDFSSYLDNGRPAYGKECDW